MERTREPVRRWPDITDPAVTAQVAARVRADLYGGTALWLWDGMVYARIMGELPRPLLRASGVGFTRFVAREDGRWDTTLSEAGYFRDPATGAFADRWANPFTGRDVTPEHIKLVTEFALEPDGAVPPRVPGLRFDGRMGPVLVNGPELWLTERLTAKFPDPAPGMEDSPLAKLRGSTLGLATFRARLADVQDPALEFVPATMSYQSLWNLYPWLDMEEFDGDVVWQLAGEKVAGPGALPRDLRARIDADHPGFLDDPGL